MSLSERVMSMGRRLADLVREARAFRPPASREASAKGELDEVEGARRDWLVAQMYFDAVGEPELVDQAIHRILAAERRYMYLLRKAREDRISLPMTPPGA